MQEPALQEPALKQVRTFVSNNPVLGYHINIMEMFFNFQPQLVITWAVYWRPQMILNEGSSFIVCSCRMRLFNRKIVSGLDIKLMV